MSEMPETIVRCMGKAAREALAPTPDPDRTAESRKPTGESDHQWGAFLLQKATEDPTRLSDYAAGAYSACNTLEEFQSVTINLERARKIAATRNASLEQP